jgi:lipooligosaccharide transport system permease protein
MFLFSGVFLPLSQYPEAVQWIVRVTPLYQGVVLERSFVLGHVEWSLFLNAAYLVIMAWLGLSVATRRLIRMLQP